MKTSKAATLAARRKKDLDRAKREKHWQKTKKDKNRTAHNTMCFRHKAVKYYIKRCLHGSEREAVENVKEKFKIGASSIRKFYKLFISEGRKALKPKIREIKNTNPSTPFCVVEIIMFMRVHLGWGGLRISQQLKHLELYEISHTGVYNIFKRYNVETKTYHPRGKRDGIKYKRYEKKHPNDLWHLDFCGPFIMPSGQKVWVLLIIDDHSRALLGLDVVETLETDNVITILEQKFKDYGMPKALMTDNATTFVSVWQEDTHKFKDFLEACQIKHQRIPAYYPQANGKAEAAVKIVKREVIKPFMEQNELNGNTGKIKNFQSLGCGFEQKVLSNSVWTINDFQSLLDSYREFYNMQRVHGGIGWVCPYQRYSKALPAKNLKLTA